MSKRFKKLAAVVLASAMLLQNGASLLAEEAQTPPAETVVTEAPAEPQTPAPEETPTEPQTPAPTEAPTEPQTPAPTEAPTEPQTPAPTEAPAEPQTSASTEAPAEPQTEAPVEETELSERENDGEEFAAASLVEKLQQALTYLFAAEKIDAAKGLLKGQEITDGAEGKAVADALKEISLQLANAKDSSEVQVLNLYADEEGTLDTAQLDEQFEDQVIDVTKQYFVVNVIANSADQALTFSGYKMKLDGAPVEYAEGTEPGDVIYNFAALDDAGDYIDYTGELSLNNAEGLQGTFLAPAAKVTVGSDLAGAVFAQSVTVADSVKELMQISFVTGREPAEETETEKPESEPGTTAAETEESESEPETPGTTAAETEESESGTSGMTAAETEESESETSAITAAETEELPMPTYGDEEGPETPVVTASVKVQFSGHDLYALDGEDGMYEENIGLPYVSLFTKDNESYTRVATVEPKKLTFTKDGTEVELTYKKTELPDPSGGSSTTETTYYLKLTDKKGEELSGESTNPVLKNASSSTEAEISFKYEGREIKLSNLVLDYGSNTEDFPVGFYYPVTLNLTKKFFGSDGAAKTSSETFYASVYKDVGHTALLEGSSPAAFDMKGSSTATATVALKATSSPVTLYLAESDASGTAIGAEGVTASQLHFTAKVEPAQFEAKIDNEAGNAFTATITNTLKAPSVKVGVVNGNGRNLAGVKLVIKDDKGKVLTVVNNAKSFASGSTDLSVNLKPGTYYLSEVSAPSGYAPAKDVQFTVEDGKETVAHLTNVSASSTAYKLTVNKQVYFGDYQLYAKNAQTYYFALFEGTDHLVKVSDVMALTMSGMTGTVTFENLTHNANYFLAETDEYGDPNLSGLGYTVKYENGGMVQMDARTKTTVVRNDYNDMPSGFRYNATLTITKHVTSASGAAKAVEDETFYVGIYKKADYSDKPTVVSLSLKNKAAASVRRRITFGNNNNPSVTYYFAEVDADGNRVDNTDTFGYNVSIDPPSMTIKRGEDKKATVTNQEKSSKVTLYLTKRVYEGTALKPVTDTFYVGLFRDAKFTKLYTNPIPMQLQNKSELTLKLSLNLGTADKVTIYLAETDQSGNVIRNESQFGYNIRAINSTAVFTQQRREIQAIFLNSVYGTSTDDDWKQILSDENNQPAYGGSDGWVGGNGEIDPNADTVAAQTGDETPIVLYIGLLAAAAVVLILLLILRMRKKKRE